MAKKVAKKKSRKAGIKNVPLEFFLLELAVNETWRAVYSDATEREKKGMLSGEPFMLGNNTIDALLSGKAGAVRARLDLSDQQGTPTPKPPAKRKASKKR